MRGGLLWLCLALAASPLGGCVSIGRAILVPKFRIDVPAAPLREVTADAVAATGASGTGASEPAPIAVPEREIAATIEPATPAPAPERTDVQGRGDGSMKLDRPLDRVVVTGVRPIPHRAPDYSPEQVAAMVCITARFGFSSKTALRAHEATLAARDARADLEAHRISQKQADDIELKRQSAVRAFMSPIPLLNLFGESGEKKSGLPAPRYGDVTIEDTDLYTFEENGAPVMAVSGVVRNAGKDRVELPPVTLRALDAWAFVLAGQTSLLPFETLGPGEAKPFEVRFLNPPEYTAEVYVHFAPPFNFRAPRDCDFFDPATFDPDKPLGDITQPEDSLTAPKLTIGGIRSFIADSGPHAGATTPDYTAAELNVLTQFYRRESAEVWRCHSREEQRAGRRCASADQKLGWRDMFRMAEATDEAWAALRVADQAKATIAAGGSQPDGSQEAADAAEAARVEAMAKVRAMGDAALARAGGSSRDVLVDNTTSTLGYDGKTVYVDVAGRLRNTGAAPERITALMIAAVDRFGLPLLSLAIPFGQTLAPGASADFSQHVPISQPPPRQLDWSVRIGAMERPGGTG